MKLHITILFLSVGLLLFAVPAVATQAESPETGGSAVSLTASDNNTQEMVTSEASAENPDNSSTNESSENDGTDKELSRQLDPASLEEETGAGFQKDLTTKELDNETGAGFKRISPTELELTSGRGFGTDLSYDQLENTVGQGFISKLSPDEIDKISGRGNLSDEQIQLTVRSLGQITAQGVKFVVDKSKFSSEELNEIEGRGDLTEVGRAPYSIQIGLFKDKQNALAMLENVRKKGYDPYIFRTRDENGTPLFAVRLGDYETIQQAYADVTHYKGKEHKEAFVTYINSLQSVQKEDLMKEEATGSEGAVAIDLDKKYPEGDLETLYMQLQALEDEVEKLRIESEARKKLKMTEAEERKEEEEILSAAGREYTMARAGTLSFDYSFGYTYNSFDEANWEEGRLKHTSNHNLTNTVSARYAVYDNLSLGTSVPFKYKYHELGISGSKDVTDLGDISLSANWQPFKIGGELPPVILTSSISLPTGRSPYEINPAVDLATGSGVYAVSIGCTGNKTIDPVVLFGGLTYSYQLEEDDLSYHGSSNNLTLKKVEPSDGIGASMGIGYAMSYKATVNASISASYAFGTTYEYENGETRSTGTSLTASLNVGTGWRISPERTISVNVGIGLSNDASDFSVGFRIPFDYEL